MLIFLLIFCTKIICSAFMYGMQKKIGESKNFYGIPYDMTHFACKKIIFRDHPSTIKKRFFSVFIVMLISPLFIYLFSSPDLLKNYSLWSVIGLRTEGFVSALIYPLLLTVILFIGPLSQQLSNGIWKIYSGNRFKIKLTNIKF